MTEAKACLKVWILTDDHGQVSDQAFIMLASGPPLAAFAYPLGTGMETNN